MLGMNDSLDYYSPDDLDVRVAELIVATPDAADEGVHPKVQEVLALLREKLSMDVVFVSEFVDQRRVFRFVDRAADAPALAPGMSDPIEDSWCQRVAEGRIPEWIPDAKPVIAAGRVPPTDIEIGTHISTPIRSRSGQPLGTLCCFSRKVVESSTEQDLRRLQHTAKMLVSYLDQTHSWPGLPSR
jgi:GAF domain-containing protein